MYKIFVKNVFNETLKNLPQMLKKSVFFSFFQYKEYICISKVLQLSQTIENSNLKNDLKIECFYIRVRRSFPNYYDAKILTNNHCISSSSASLTVRPCPWGQWQATAGLPELQGPPNLTTEMRVPWRHRPAGLPSACAQTPGQGQHLKSLPRPMGRGPQSRDPKAWKQTP